MRTSDQQGPHRPLTMATFSIDYAALFLLVLALFASPALGKGGK